MTDHERAELLSIIERLGRPEAREVMVHVKKAAEAFGNAVGIKAETLVARMTALGKDSVGDGDGQKLVKKGVFADESENGKKAVSGDDS